MVKKQRRQLVFLALLALAGLLLLYWNLGSRTAVMVSASSDTKGSEPLTLDDVVPIGLDRLARVGEVEKGDADDAEARAASSRAAKVPPVGVGSTPTPEIVAAVVPAEPTPPPMNVQFIGAVEIRSGVWVASLITDRKDLLLGKEGEIIGNRYRIVKIGIQSIDLLETASGRQRRVQLGGS
jgi:hypothetical protein